MTQDFFLGQLRLILVAVIAYATGKGWLSNADSGLIGAISAPIGLLVGPWAWSIYTNLNRKLVPNESVAVAKSDVVGGAVIGSQISPSNGTMKVVG